MSNAPAKPRIQGQKACIAVPHLAILYLARHFSLATLTPSLSLDRHDGAVS